MAIVEVWPQWVQQSYYTQTSATTDTGSNCWRLWIAGDNGTTCGSVWTIWASNTYEPDNTSTYTTSAPVWEAWAKIPSLAQPVKFTAEELAALEAKAKVDQAKRKVEKEEADRKYQEQLRREKESAERAMQLLKEFLSEQQRIELEKHKHVKVVGSRGKTKYLIELSGRVYELADETTKVASYCIHSKDMCYPDGDEVLAKVLLLQADEDRFLKTANKTVLQPVVR